MPQQRRNNNKRLRLAAPGELDNNGDAEVVPDEARSSSQSSPPRRSPATTPTNNTQEESNAADPVVPDEATSGNHHHHQSHPDPVPDPAPTTTTTTTIPDEAPSGAHQSHPDPVPDAIPDPATTTTASTISNSDENSSSSPANRIQPHYSSEIASIIFKELAPTTTTTNPQTIAIAMEKLHDLLEFNPNDKKKKWKQNRSEACRLGGHAIILTILKGFPLEQEVQEWGCFCMYALSYDSKADCTLIDCGAVETVLNALSQFPTHCGITWSACGCLRNLLSSYPDDPITKRRVTNRFVCDYGGIETIVQAMKNFPDDSEILKECFILFQNLTPKTPFRDAMIQAEVVTTIAKVLKKFPRSSTVAQEGVQTMKKIHQATPDTTTNTTTKRLRLARRTL